MDMENFPRALFERMPDTDRPPTTYNEQPCSVHICQQMFVDADAPDWGLANELLGIRTSSIICRKLV